MFFSRIKKKIPLTVKKIYIILTGSLKDHVLQDYLTVMRIMSLSVLIIEKHNSKFKSPSILISEDEISFSTTSMPISNFWVLFQYHGVLLTQPKLLRNVPRFTPKSKKKRQKLDRSYHAQSPGELEFNGTDQQELRNAAKAMLHSLPWRCPYGAGRPSTQVTGVHGPVRNRILTQTFKIF